MKQELDFHEALYKMSCPKCNGTVEWEAQFDADGTTYYGEHTDCGLSFRMVPSTVIVTTEKLTEDK